MTDQDLMREMINSNCPIYRRFLARQLGDRLAEDVIDNFNREMDRLERQDEQRRRRRGECPRCR